jgi:hypothetical protein
MSCHSVAVVLTLVQTKQIRINTPKRNNTKQIRIYINETIQKAQYKKFDRKKMSHISLSYSNDIHS